jgi:hypothetical protein
MEWNIIVGLVCTVLGAVISYATFSRNKGKDDRSNGQQLGTVLTELGYIKSNTDEIKTEQREQRKTNTEVEGRWLPWRPAPSPHTTALTIWRRYEMKNIKTTTRRLFVTTQIAALGWVTMSYLIALYATVHLGQVFPVVDLSEQAIETILGVNVLKVVENIFEHNDGVVFGKSNAPEKKIKRDC